MNGGGGAVYMSEDEYDDYPTSGKPGGGHSGGYFAPGPSGSGGASGGLGGGGGNQSRNQMCCLVDDRNRCHRPAGNASYSKRIQRTAYYKRLKLEIDNTANHIYICDHHKMVIQNARSRQKHGSDDELNEGDDTPEVDLFQLQVNTLRRYKKHFKIPTRPGLNKAQLADILSRHFKTIPVSEKEIITYFIYMVKSGRNKLDNRAEQDPNAGGATGCSTNHEYLDRY